MPEPTPDVLTRAKRIRLLLMDIDGTLSGGVCLIALPNDGGVAEMKVFDPHDGLALKLAHKDIALANALGRELGMPMRMCNLALAEMTEALARGWGGRDSRAVMLLQQERAGIEIAVDPERLRAVLTPDGEQDGSKPT